LYFLLPRVCSSGLFCSTFAIVGLVCNQFYGEEKLEPSAKHLHVFHKESQTVQVWKNMMVSKWWYQVECGQKWCL